MSLFDLFFRDKLASPELDEFEHLAARLSAWALTQHNPDGTHNFGATGSALLPIGSMVMWGGATAPTSWLLCDGSPVSRSTYSGLFSAIGTVYGAGDGSTTFNVPDLRQRFPLGKAASGTGSTLGSTGGAIDHTHTAGSVSGSTATGTTGTANTGTGTTGTGTTGDGISRLPSGGTGAPNYDVGTAHQPANNDHVHYIDGLSIPGLSVPALSIPGLSIPALGAGTLAVGTSGTANPAYQVVNYIILSGI